MTEAVVTKDVAPFKDLKNVSQLVNFWGETGSDYEQKNRIDSYNFMFRNCIYGHFRTAGSIVKSKHC